MFVVATATLLDHVIILFDGFLECRERCYDGPLERHWGRQEVFFQGSQVSREMVGLSYTMIVKSVHWDRNGFAVDVLVFRVLRLLPTGYLAGGHVRDERNNGSSLIGCIEQGRNYLYLVEGIFMGHFFRVVLGAGIVGSYGCCVGIFGVPQQLTQGSCRRAISAFNGPIPRKFPVKRHWICLGRLWLATGSQFAVKRWILGVQKHRPSLPRLPWA